MEWSRSFLCVLVVERSAVEAPLAAAAMARTGLWMVMTQDYRETGTEGLVRHRREIVAVHHRAGEVLA